MDNCIYGPLVEEWRHVIGYEGLYQVSNYGLIRSLDRSFLRNGITVNLKGVMIKQLVTVNGYSYVSFYKNSVRQKPMSHKTVSRSFLNIENDKTHVNHKNGIRDDNFILNLEMVSARENITHGFVCGTNRPKKSSKYMGVTWVKKRHKWRVCINHNKRQVNLGCYVNEEEAGMAYIKALELYGYENRYA